MKSVVIILMMISTSIFASNPDYPDGPNPRLTPGKLCDRPTATRYPQNIAYCERAVNLETKEAVIRQYDVELGYHIQTLNRADFKIDHYIPLCAGGSNDPSNLWPQHKSVFIITDPIEPLVCAKMAEGVLQQDVAVKLIIRAKNDLSQVRDVMKILNRL